MAISVTAEDHGDQLNTMVAGVSNQGDVCSVQAQFRVVSVAIKEPCQGVILRLLVFVGTVFSGWLYC